MPSSSAAIWARVVWWPCPCPHVPTATATFPEGSIFRWALSRPGVMAIFLRAKARVPYPVRSAKHEKPRPIKRPGALLKGLDVAARIVDDPGRALVGKLFGRDQITAPDLDGVHAQPLRGLLHQPLHHKRELGPRHPPVGRHGDLVRRDRARS